MIPSLPGSSGVPSGPNIPQPGMPDPDIPQPPGGPPITPSNALWLMIKEDLEALSREVSKMGEKLGALQGRVTALEARIEASTPRLQP